MMKDAKRITMNDDRHAMIWSNCFREEYYDQD